MRAVLLVAGTLVVAVASPSPGGIGVNHRRAASRGPERILSDEAQKRHRWIRLLPSCVEADVELGKGKKVPEVCKLIEITEQTYYRWRQKYGGMQPEMAKQLKGLEKENARLKKMVAEQALDMEILKEAAKGNW